MPPNTLFFRQVDWQLSINAPIHLEQLCGPATITLSNKSQYPISTVLIYLAEGTLCLPPSFSFPLFLSYRRFATPIAATKAALSLPPASPSRSSFSRGLTFFLSSVLPFPQCPRAYRSWCKSSASISPWTSCNLKLREGQIWQTSDFCPFS